jgi:signal transduction histidine kinase/CheY-like chemotaxis protein
MSLLARWISVEQINDLRGLVLPGSLPLGEVLLRNMSTASRHSLIVACFVFAAFAILNLDKPRMAWLFGAGCFFLAVALLNIYQIESTLRSQPSMKRVQSTFLRSFALLTVLGLTLALTPWLIGSSLTAYAELLTTLIVIGYCLIFAVTYSIFPLSVLTFGLINGVSVAFYWISTHYDFKWPLAILTLVFFGFLFVVTLNFGRVLRRALTLQIERDEARLKAESAARSLEDALVSLKRASFEKLRLFAAANHDLRQPISAISLFVGVLQRKLHRKVGPDAEIKDLIEKLDRNLAALDSIVGSLSDITALETGDFAPRAEMFELNALIEPIVLEFAGQCEIKGTSLQIDVPQTHLFSDPRMLTRIIRSALDNAIKYASSKAVLIAVMNDASGKFLSIRDFGPGIPDNLRAQVTDDYIQLDNPGRDRKKGYGVGLSIAKRMALALGSHIELRHPEGGGLEFLVEIGALVSKQSGQMPRHDFEAGPSLEDAHVDKAHLERVTLTDQGNTRRRLKIVVVDDDDDVRAGLKALFETWGQEVEDFASIELTSGHLSSLSGMQQPDHILVDNWLPDGRGLDAVRNFRTLSPRAHLTLLTGDTDAQTLRRASELNIEVLLKPVTAERLGRLLLSSNG